MNESVNMAEPGDNSWFSHRKSWSVSLCGFALDAAEECCGKNMEGRTMGLEPTTHGITIHCSAS